MDVPGVKRWFKKYKPDKNIHIKISISGNDSEFRAFKSNRIYKKLIQNEVKIVFKPVSNRSGVQQKEHTNFFKQVFIEKVKKLPTRTRLVYEDITAS